MELTLLVFPVSTRVPRGCHWLRTEEPRGTRADTGKSDVFADQETHDGSYRSWVAAERSDAAPGDPGPSGSMCVFKFADPTRLHVLGFDPIQLAWMMNEMVS